MHSEVTLKHKEDILWFINFDETKHKLGTGVKDRVQVQRYHNPLFPQAGKRSKLITGVYSTNPLKEISLLFIFNTKAKSESNYNLDPAWCHGLSKVKRKYGTGCKREWKSFVVMWPKGGMDATLFPLYIHHCEHQDF